MARRARPEERSKAIERRLREQVAACTRLLNDLGILGYSGHVGARLPGRDAFLAFWPAVVCSTFAFTALFMLIGTYFRRPAVVAIVYSFFLEVILDNMPGFLKRASVSRFRRS